MFHYLYTSLSSDLFAELVIFGVLAVVRTVIVDIIWWRWLVTWMTNHPWSWEYSKKFGINVYANSHAVAFIVSSLTSYVLNRYITFSVNVVDNEVASITSFFVTNTITLIISIGLINLLTSWKPLLEIVYSFNFPLFGKLSEKQWALLAKVFTISVVMVLNFASYKFLVFQV